jgi:hypothetical protein
MVLSPLPDSTRVPSGENATERTQRECPLKVRMSAPVVASQSLIVLSLLLERTRVPSADHATELMIEPVCASIGTISILGRSWAPAPGATENIARAAKPIAGPSRPNRMSRMPAPPIK